MITDAPAAPKTEKTEQEKIRDTQLGGLSSWVRDIFSSFKDARRPWEEMWIECHYNYMAKYQPELNWRKETEGEAGNSRIFIKTTTLKCNTAHAKVMDMAFPMTGGEEVPFDLMPIRTKVHDMMGVSEDELKATANRMRTKLREHHKEIELIENIDTAVLEMAILGTGVLKGPIIDIRTIKKYDHRMVYGQPITAFDSTVNPFEMKSEEVPLPVWKHIPLWSYYCNPNSESTKRSIGEIHFDRMLPSEFLALKTVGGYSEEKIDAVVNQTTTNVEEDFTYVQLADNYHGDQGIKDEKISVLEYWGIVKVADLRAAGADVLDHKDGELVEALVVLAGDGVVIKACLNPMGRRVFNVCPWKKVPHCIYGHGVAWAMRDSQKMINSINRMILDNKALTGPGMIAVNIDRINTKRTKNMKIYPKKVWYVKGNFAPKDAIDTVKFTDVTRDLTELSQTFERFSDEETGLPKFETGDQASFLNKTAAGMSMLMGRSNVNTKPVIKNIDDYWIEPIIEAEYEWFMEVDPDPSIKVPLRIKATGVSTMVAHEIKMENYAKFLQVTGQNPADAMMVDRPKMIRNYAKMLDSEEIMHSDEQIKALVAEAASRANAPKDLREFVAIDKIFPYLSVEEQNQIVTQLGVTPSPQGRQDLRTADLAVKTAKAQADKNKNLPAPAAAS